MSKDDRHIREISRGFYMIDLPMPFRLGHVNVFLYLHEKRGVLFDTGLNVYGVMPQLEKALESLDLTIESIDDIFLTHFHADHCGIAGLIKERSGATIHMSEKGKRHIERLGKEALIREVMTGFLFRHGFPSKTLDSIMRLFSHFKRVTASFDVDEILEGGEIRTAGGRTFEVISTPGHANGHDCFYFGDEGILLSGDHVLPDITPNLGPDLFDPDYRPLDSFLASLDRVRDLPVTIVCPAHGAPFTNLKGRVDEIKDHHRERKALVLESARKGPKTTYEISLDVFQDELSEFDKFLALNETYVHIIELIEERKIGEEEEDGHIVYAAC
ncbi:MAG: MBL fold metallo-hydrolase [Thermodesulfobacteriota bacterium]|nr:MBL fold metallo-hydrolase [Thermodesulfobacteriota bacterium]